MRSRGPRPCRPAPPVHQPQVYGCEFAYGGHDYGVSGIFATKPREAPGAVTFREAICVGETDRSPQQVQQLVQQMGQQYLGNGYHLLQTNCNHFASDFCMQLTGRPLPAWVSARARVLGKAAPANALGDCAGPAGVRVA